MGLNSSDVTAGTNGTATQYNNLRKDLVLGMIQGGADADAATITIDWSDKTKGKARTITLGGNRTLAFSNAAANQAIFVVITTASHTVTWPTMKWEGGVAPTLSTAIDIIAIYYDGTNYYGSVIGQNYS